MAKYPRKQHGHMAHWSAIACLSVLFACKAQDINQPADITVTTSKSLTLVAGETGDISVSVSGAKDSRVTFTSQNPAVATVSPNGQNAAVVTAVAKGEATIRIVLASDPNIAASVSVAVSSPPNAISNLQVTPVSASLKVPETAQLSPSVTAAPGAGTTQYAYVSQNPNVATVTASGLVAAVAPGTTSITVTATGAGPRLSATTLSAQVGISVADLLPALDSISLAPVTALTVQAGQSVTLSPRAFGPGVASVPVTYAYSSAQPAVATVTPGSGVVSGVSPGTADITITATTNATNLFKAARVTRTVPVTVPQLPPACGSFTIAPASLTMASGQSTPLVPTVTPNGAGVVITYSYNVDVPTVATVSQAGTVLAVAPGTANITVVASCNGTGFTPSSQTVRVPVTVLRPAIGGLAFSLPSAGLPVGRQFTIGTNAFPASAIVQVSFSFASSDTTIAAVTPLGGVITGVKPGVAIVSVTAVGAGAGFATTTITQTGPITITQAPVARVVISPSPFTLTAGTALQLTATTLDGSGGVLSGRAVSWTSSDDTKATVSSSGVVVGVAAGSVTISATSELVSASAAGTVAAGNGSWATGASMATPRQWPASTALNGLVYVMGGYNSTGDLSSVEAYNPSTNVWTTLASMPAKRYASNGVQAIGSQLYFTGGFSLGATPQASLFIFDTGTNSWSSNAPNNPASGGCGVSGAINGSLYVLTGCANSSSYVKLFNSYNPSTNSWTSRTAPSSLHVYPASAVLNGKLYVLGGINGASNSVTGFSEAYDPATNSWTPIASMPTPLYGATAQVSGGKIYVLGAGNTQVYDPNTNAWSSVAPIPTTRADAASAVIGALIYVVGGSNGASLYYSLLQIFTP